MRPLSTPLASAALLMATLLWGCQAELGDDGDYFLCDQDSACDPGFECRLVGDLEACVPEDQADQFPALDATSDTSEPDTGPDASPADTGPSDTGPGDTTSEDASPTDTGADTDPTGDSGADVVEPTGGFRLQGGVVPAGGTSMSTDYTLHGGITPSGAGEMLEGGTYKLRLTLPSSTANSP